MIDEAQYRASRPLFRDYWQPRFWPGWLAYRTIHLFTFLPQRAIWWLGAVVGEIAFHVHRTTTIKTNLALCFPELDDAERERLRRRYYHYVGRAFLALGLAWFGSQRRYQRLFTIKGLEHLDAAVARKQGVLFLAPHFIFLEPGGIFVSLSYPLVGLYRKPRNPMLHQALRYCTTRLGGLVVERYENLKPVIKAVRHGHFLYYLPDQDPDRTEDDFVFAPFFGVPAATYTAFSRLAKVTRAAVIPMFSRIRADGKGYEIELLPPLDNFPSGDDVADATRVNRIIEQAVRRNPEQYLWSYRRFKTRPDGAPSPYGKK
ncbi:MAG: lipid A biosynthesis acyltransferase [Acidiferrobacterales bacterium]